VSKQPSSQFREDLIVVAVGLAMASFVVVSVIRAVSP